MVLDLYKLFFSKSFFLQSQTKNDEGYVLTCLLQLSKALLFAFISCIYWQVTFIIPLIYIT